MKLNELVAEMRLGLEGVTPGPWTPGHLCHDEHTCNCRYIFGNDDRMGCIATVEMDDGQDMGSEYPPRAEAKANLAHIARCSPENIAYEQRGSGNDDRPPAIRKED